jgi:two-component system CheB/CheR fusion protein
LDEANSDLQNLFDSTDVATLFLDKDLVIRSFTPPVAQIFNVLPGDRGRPLADLTSRLTLPDLAGAMDEVLAGGGTVERRAADENGKMHYLVRLNPYRDAGHEIQGLVVSFLDLSDMMDAEARQGVLLAELQHRTRNLLAIVQSIASQTLEKGPSLKDFIVRLAALGRVQGLLSAAAHEQVDLGEIVRLELETLGGADDRIMIDGPPVALGIDRIQMFALALHELATNALKYGALTTSTGRIAVSWHVEAAPQGSHLVFSWRESGLPAAPESSKLGYGRKLIERAVAYSLHAKTKLLFEADGISYNIEMPLARRATVPSGPG